MISLILMKNSELGCTCDNRIKQLERGLGEALIWLGHSLVKGSSPANREARARIERLMDILSPTESLAK